MEPTLKFTYKNYRGETSAREVTPSSVYFGASKYHEGHQWFLKAFDHDKGEFRDFALADITEIQRS